MGTGTFFVLLMYFGAPVELKEFTIREDLSECLSAKRTIQRSLRGGMSRNYTGSVRVSCKELTVQYDANMNIEKVISGLD